MGVILCGVKANIFQLSDNDDFTVIGVIGAQGTGKSTLLNEISGFDVRLPILCVAKLTFVGNYGPLCSTVNENTNTVRAPDSWCRFVYNQPREANITRYTASFQP